MLIKYNREGLHHAGNLHLMPGLNEVNEKDYAEAEKWQAFKALIDEGIIEKLSTKDGKEPDFSKMSQREVLELVKATVSKDVLEEMFANEKREPVLAAITEQLEAIDPTKKA